MRRWSAFHVFLYRITGGKLGGRLVANDMLLLTTTGHRTGESHTVPLLYLRDRLGLVLVASHGGRAHHPSWYDNLTADSAVEAQIGRERRPMLARTASEEERSRLWPRIVEAYQGYAEYQSRTDREIPVVLLEPIDELEDEAG